MAKRILVIASGGGHWVQMRRLHPAFEGLDVAYVTVHADYAVDVPECRFYAIPDVTRKNLGRSLTLVPKLVSIILRERPQLVITTGALPGLVALALAKSLVGARTMWIDSIANCERLSSSGRQARRFADIWLTQWPELASTEGPLFWGRVL